MNQLKCTLSIGLVAVAILLTGTRLKAADHKTDLSKWENLKQLTPGQQIKVVLNDAKAYQGGFETVSDEAVGVLLPTGHVDFTRQDILRVSTRTGSHRGRNAAIGAAIGFGSGFPMGAGYCSDSSRGDCVAIAGTVFGALLAGVGAGVGALLPSEAWRDVYRAR